jgi:hypothetical protein
MRDDLVTASAGALDALLAALPGPRTTQGGFSTETFIAQLTPGALDEEAAATLETLARKVEVGRRLRVAYSSDLARPAGDEMVEPAFAGALAAAFAHFGMLRQDWKWINTALKMEWGILQEPTFQMSETVRRLLASLLEEAA